MSLTSCDKGTEPPQHVPTIFISEEDIGVTDAFIRVTIANDNKPSSFTLTRDGKTFFTAAIRDTLILTDSLLPKHSYVLKAYRFDGSAVFDSSDALTVTTMDTTSHEFTWLKDTLGDGNSSVLNDVCIVTDTCVVATGELYLRDSTGNFETEPYGVAIWKGAKWTLSKLHATGPTGTISTLGPRGVFAFSPTDVWMAEGGVFHWDGETVTPYWINSFPGNPTPILAPGQTAEKLWGNSSSDMYAVGKKGAIAHFDGTHWKKLETATTLDINDVWGGINPTDGALEVLAVAALPFDSFEKRVLRITVTSVTELSDSGIEEPLSTVWFSAGRRYYAAGSGLYEKRRLTEPRWGSHLNDITPYYVYMIRGNEINDVFAAGGYGEVLHFNGSSWQSFFPSTRLGSGNYYSLAARGGLILAVGLEYPRAVICIGRR